MATIIHILRWRCKLLNLITSNRFVRHNSCYYFQKNKEFQWYVVDDENSFAKDGKLHIKPTLAADKIGNEAIESGYVHLDDCTDSNKANCERQAGGNVIINPVRSARLTTSKSFSFKYGRVEVIAKLPVGDWLWPAVWLLPTDWVTIVYFRCIKVDLTKKSPNRFEYSTGVWRVAQIWRGRYL